MCDDPKRCQSHQKTMEELEELKKQNENFRKELDDLKEVINGLHDIERTIRDIYKHHRHPVLTAIIKFFEGGNKK